MGAVTPVAALCDYRYNTEALVLALSLYAFFQYSKSAIDRIVRVRERGRVIRRVIRPRSGV